MSTATKGHNKDKLPIKYTYPVIMKGKMSGRLVRFTAHGVGTIVGSGNGSTGASKAIGHYSDTWAMWQFKPYRGKED